MLEEGDVFLPLEQRVSEATARRVEEVVRRARTGGYPVKVAVIGGPADLGEVYQFWGRPQSYARFLGSLLKLGFGGDLLVVMPVGFGVSRAGRDVDSQPLRRLRVTPGINGLANSATTAVAALAAASGHPISVPAAAPAPLPADDNRCRDRFIIGAVGAIFVVLVFLVPLLSRRRLARRTR